MGQSVRGRRGTRTPSIAPVRSRVVGEGVPVARSRLATCRTVSPVTDLRREALLRGGAFGPGVGACDQVVTQARRPGGLAAMPPLAFCERQTFLAPVPGAPTPARLPHRRSRPAISTCSGWKPWATSYRCRPAAGARVQALADVLGQVAGGQPRLRERPGADREIPEQRDMDMPRPQVSRLSGWGTHRPTAKWTCRPCPPGCHSEAQATETAHPERRPQRLEERPHVGAQLRRVEAALAGVGQRPQAVQPVRDMYRRSFLRARGPPPPPIAPGHRPPSTPAGPGRSGSHPPPLPPGTGSAARTPADARTQPREAEAGGSSSLTSETMTERSDGVSGLWTSPSPPASSPSVPPGDAPRW